MEARPQHFPRPTGLLVVLMLVAAAAATPRPALGGGSKEVPAATGPRWSNDGHLASRRTAADDCAPGYRADYESGRDAWGQPVAPAELPGGRSKKLPFPIEVEVLRGRGAAAADTVAGGTVVGDTVAGDTVTDGALEASRARVFVDPESLDRLMKESQDCVPSAK